jgi:uncharacterized protein YfaS (alpha-2-macroglobulin family)
VRYPLIAEAGADSFGENNFTVLTNFTFRSRSIENLRQGRAARLNDSWDIDFNSTIDPETFRSAFSISPQPPSLRLYFYGSTVQIRAVFDIGRIYSMKLAEDFTDVLGNRLKESLSFAFKSQDLPPVFILPKEALVLETGTNRIPAKYRNIGHLSISVSKYDNPGAYIRALSGQDAGGRTGAKDHNYIEINPNPNSLNKLYQADLGIDAGPGLKFLDIRTGGRGSEAGGDAYFQSLLVQTTNIGISAKVSDGAVFCWVTALNNGVAIQGARVSVYDAQGKVIAGGASSVTDRNGTVLIKTGAAKSAQLDNTIYATAEYNGDAAICTLANNEMSSPWQFNLPGAVAGANPLAAALFTERGAYRPGDSVYFKTFVRDLPEYQDLNQAGLTVKDSRGREVYNNKKNLDAYRGAAWELRLANDAAVGEYTVALILGDYIAHTSFQVEEYRVPTFQVNVTSSDPEWRKGLPARAESSAKP